MLTYKEILKYYAHESFATIKKLIKKLRNSREKTKKSLIKTIESQVKYYNKHHRLIKFQIKNKI